MLYNTINNYINEFLNLIDKQIPFEKEKAKEDMKNNTFLNSNKYIRYKYPAYFFLFEVAILFFFVFTIIQFTDLIPTFISRLGVLMNPDKISKLSLPIFSMIDKQNDLIKESWEKWYEYFYLNNPNRFYDIEQSFINSGNSSRPFLNFFFTNILPSFILGYFIWICIKYYQYVIAAIWGFFIMLYSFFTKKVECTLGGKWYIRLVTGWKKCKVSFGSYLNKWIDDFIIRPIKEQHINYRKAYDQIKSPDSNVSILFNKILIFLLRILEYILSFLNKISMLFNLSFFGITSFFKNIWNTIYSFFISLFILFGFKTQSKTETGENCECSKSNFKNKDFKSSTPNIIFDLLILFILFYMLNLYDTKYIQYILLSFKNILNQYTNGNVELNNIIIVSISTFIAILFYSIDIYLSY
jgi:hypothetical protein